MRSAGTALSQLCPGPAETEPLGQFYGGDRSIGQPSGCWVDEKQEAAAPPFRLMPEGRETKQKQNSTAGFMTSCCSPHPAWTRWTPFEPVQQRLQYCGLLRKYVGEA